MIKAKEPIDRYIYQLICVRVRPLRRVRYSGETTAGACGMIAPAAPQERPSRREHMTAHGAVHGAAQAQRRRRAVRRAVRKRTPSHSNPETRRSLRARAPRGLWPRLLAAAAPAPVPGRALRRSACEWRLAYTCGCAAAAAGGGRLLTGKLPGSRMVPSSCAAHYEDSWAAHGAQAGSSFLCVDPKLAWSFAGRDLLGAWVRAKGRRISAWRTTR